MILRLIPLKDILIKKSNEFNIPLIGTNNIKFGGQEEFAAHDALLCVAQKTTINNGSRKTSNNQIAFKNDEEMFGLFSDIPEVIENNFNVAISCSYYPKEVTPKLPKFKNNLNLSESQLLVRMAKNGLIQKIKEKKVQEKKLYENRLKI